MRGRCSQLEAVMRSLLLLLAVLAFCAGCAPSNPPLPIAPGARFEIFEVTVASDPTAAKAIDPETGGPLFLKQPAIITTADVATVAREGIEERTKTNHAAIHVELTPAGAAKMATATAKATRGQLAVVVNGSVISCPRLIAPFSGSFRVTGDLRDGQFVAAVDDLTKQ